MKNLVWLFLLLTTPTPALHAQVLKSIGQEQAEGESDELIRQIIDMNFLFQGQEDLPYSVQPSPWGGALLPDPSYDPNYRIPEQERIYPPGYLERKKQKPEAIR
jgi:hypothetical protein